MKQKLHFLFVLFAFLNIQFIVSQTTEDFETETTGATTFTDNGQNFTITNGSGESTYDIELFNSGGWNGSTVDNKFIDNSSGLPANGDGSSFSITTTDGTDITVKSFYLFVSNRAISGPGTPTTITIEGKKDGSTVFTIIKNSGIVDGSTFTPNNGFTFIDLALEGGTDNSSENIDELIISSTGNADYLALDAFTWGTEVLSTNNTGFKQNEIKIYPNPSSEKITISGLAQEEHYIIYNVLGSKIKSGIISDKQEIDIKNLINGLYIIKINNGDTFKFIKD